MYGSTFLNSNSSEIKAALEDSNKKITFMLADENNIFLENYEEYWGYKKGAFKDYINDTVENLKKWHNAISPDKKATLEIYKYTKGCFTYSYYKMNNDLYFVPNKAVAEKSFKPITIYAKKNYK
ncbi:hypothetical protein [Acinetobacter venetianus]|uniref:hypothetical protein n=1 Tax=Acinetobacter venetianus TaxID=52133 RepID=UPI0007784477|nr:hypothetical protein [Acinetobacter venetianus]KXZ67252.1 hypothetical protein AVENLUH7437_00371 [Acinetobacter venetianus]